MWNRDDNGNFILSQDVILYRAKTQSDPKSSEDVTSLNDKVRLFGICLQDCNSDDLLYRVRQGTSMTILAIKREPSMPNSKRNSTETA